ncbi:glycosyltransferase family 4 protein [Sutcliffiella deserti]|uniref:glycosyltransferase family 4 protein n=1 Tax=Sutcliffiella deserti TaxID=2875501 RepID=UPI001CBB7D7C|nr:glycosyltransferase family 4 protein [Sutcliffiella deserti]
MNVLLVTDKLIMGGAENYFCKLENELSHPDFSFYYAAAPGELYRNIQEKQRFTFLHKKNHILNLRILWKLMTTKNIKIYHANSLRMVFYAVVLSCFIKSKFSIVYTKHNVTLLEKYFPYLFRKFLNKYTSKIITVSDFEKYQLINHGIESRKICTVYNGVDLKRFEYQHKKNLPQKKVGILARISKEKNHDFFLEVADACRNHPNITFHIAGDGPDFHALQLQRDKMGLQEKVQMLGGVNTPEEFLRDMDILLVTSHREVFPMVVLEAMSVGTPIISIDKGGINEAIDNGESGYLISEHSKEEFCNKIEYLLANELKRLQLVKEARTKVESNFSLKRMIECTLAVYLKVTGEKIGSQTKERSMVKDVLNSDR